ncbi:ArsR family transcriptional regulator [Glutamicibacter creatinolyticus]|uniref:ArsR family transcriptional regulator n=1 Tax=Glutamicibacter creatinolyticus TaxID=162496 RepID=A0A5B7WWQ4_9MICC|nr:ArsR family transcriptional regulator [Glutamicibacter creatinolyticus]
MLNIWDGGESVSVEQIPSKRNVKHTSVMGSRYATGLSATVQMFLAHQPAETHQLRGNVTG